MRHGQEKSNSQKEECQQKKASPEKETSRKEEACEEESKATLKKRAPAKKKLAKSAKKKSSSRRTGGAPSRTRETTSFESRRGLGAESGGQSGDTQGLSRREYSDSESVEELMEEGQYLEAEAVGGVENALDPDEGEIRTHEVPEDDVPEEYLDRDE